MQIYLREKIGKPELFTGRKKEINEFLGWIYNIKDEMSKSIALLSRRKTGKSALMQRLFNIVFHRKYNKYKGSYAEQQNILQNNS